MHELSLIRDLARVGLAAAEGRPVKRFVLEVGQLTCVSPEALRFAFEAIRAEDPLLRGAELELVIVPGRGRCRDCGALVELSAAWDACPCGGALDWLAGDGLLLKTLEVAHV